MASDERIAELYEFLSGDKTRSKETDSEQDLTLTLCRGSDHDLSEETLNRWKRLKRKVSGLEYDDKIDISEFETFWDRVLLEHKYEDDPRVKRWRQWERDRRFELPLTEKKISGNRCLVLPDIFLLIESGTGLSGFFPCSDGETEYSIEGVIERLEEGGDWEKWGENESTLSSGDPSKIHGAIKSYIKGNSEEELGGEWKYIKEEYPVGVNEWSIDLIFKHRSDNKYNLVEAKPSKEAEKIDKAFGQLFRYRHSFLKNKVNVSLDDVELTIAAPDFYDAHQEAAEELGIQLVRTPYSNAG
jgi:hypothetical protein